MKRFLPALLPLLASFGLNGRPASAQEMVYYYSSPETRTEPKDSPLRGRIKQETPGGVIINVGGKEDRVIPALSIVQIGYVTKDKTPLDFREAFSGINRAARLDPRTKAKERSELLTKALANFTELAPAVADQPAAKRYVAYRIAEIQYLLSIGEPLLRPKAIQALEDYAAANPGGWEIVPTLMTLARLHEQANDLEKSRSALERLADLPDAPKEIVRAGNVAVSQMLMRAKHYPDAEKRLHALLDSLPPGDPQRARTQVYLVQCQVAQKKTDGAEQQLKDAISGTSEPLLRGIAYNVLGDYYRAKGQTEEAFWAYLRVDTMYNLDANEHAKAIYYLSELFKEKKFGDRTGDPVRAKNYHDRLLDARFAATDYYKLVEKKP